MPPKGRPVGVRRGIAAERGSGEAHESKDRRYHRDIPVASGRDAGSDGGLAGNTCPLIEAALTVPVVSWRTGRAAP